MQSVTTTEKSSIQKSTDMDGISLDSRSSTKRGLNAQDLGCSHLSLLLKSSSRDIALKSYSHAVRVSLCCDSPNNFIKKKKDHDSKLAEAKDIRKWYYRVIGCSDCGEVLTTTFMCLQCPYVGCRRRDHAAKHAKASNHLFGVDTRLARIFCFKCNNYVFDPAFEKVRRRIQRLLVHPRRSQHAIDTMSVEEQEQSNMPCIALSGLRGLQNMGATCFMSVILQSLIHNPFIRNEFLSGVHDSSVCQRFNCLLCRLDEIFKDFYAGNDKTGFSPVQLLITAWQTQRNLAGYSEQDAHEFLQFMLNQMHLASLPEGLDISGDQCNCIVHRTFCGLLESRITCQKCGNVKVTTEPILDLSVQIKDKANHESLNLEECLKRFTSPEKLDTKLSCATCGSPQLAIKQLKIKRLPMVLCIQLKRFQHTSTLSKIDDHVVFPLKLDLSPLVVDPDKQGVASGRYTYELFGIICHHGQINTGHYTCMMKTSTGAWFNFDDSMVTTVKNSELTSANAYLLLYTISDLS